MIFQKEHIEKIINRTKSQTRRSSDRYKEYTLYAVQPKRGAKGIPEGKLVIGLTKREWKPDLSDIPEDAHFARAIRSSEAGYPISDWEAQAEGGYTPEEYEKLYESMYPGWTERWTYFFQFWDQEQIEAFKA